MQLIRKLLRRNSSRFARSTNRGLSTAELVGIIVIVGILGAIGGTYVNGLVTQANTNAGRQNASTLNTLAASVLAAGATVGAPGASAGGAANTIDTTSAATAIADLNGGVTVNNVLYKMTPPISAAAIATLGGAAPSYSMTGAGTNNVVFTYNLGTTP